MLERQLLFWLWFCSFSLGNNQTLTLSTAPPSLTNSHVMQPEFCIKPTLYVSLYKRPSEKQCSGGISAHRKAVVKGRGGQSVLSLNTHCWSLSMRLVQLCILKKKKPVYSSKVFRKKELNCCCCRCCVSPPGIRKCSTDFSHANSHTVAEGTAKKNKKKTQMGWEIYFVKI